jgi:arginyl-tRNA--protein-N-Asp/Glu arginylyltransferase
MRKERRLEKLRQKGLEPEEVKSKQVQEVKSLEQFLHTPASAKHKLEVNDLIVEAMQFLTCGLYALQLRLVQSNPPSAEYKETEQDSYNVYKKYQISVHDDPPEKVTLKQFTRFLVDSPLDVRLIYHICAFSSLNLYRCSRRWAKVVKILARTISSTGWMGN